MYLYLTQQILYSFNEAKEDFLEYSEKPLKEYELLEDGSEAYSRVLLYRI